MYIFDNILSYSIISIYYIYAKIYIDFFAYNIAKYQHESVDNGNIQDRQTKER